MTAIRVAADGSLCYTLIIIIILVKPKVRHKQLAVTRSRDVVINNLSLERFIDRGDRTSSPESAVIFFFFSLM